MSTHVYANGLEISSQAADGIASVAFPDPCWSPPAPPAGPVVIPYPNTARPKSLKNGSCTVFICGKPVALEDHSYFSTSTGNEAATQAFGKGVATGVIKGKAYHRSWSMDVMIEGRGVARHTDLMTHNHGSMPGNTPTFPYISRGIFKRNDCKKEEKRIERACKPESEDSDARREIRSKSKIASLLKKRRKKPSKSADGKKWHWTDDHCDGLGMSLGTYEKAKDYAEELKETFVSMKDELQALLEIETLLKDMVMDAAKWAAGKWAAKTALKQVAGSAIPLAGNITMGVWSVVDGVRAIGDVSQIRAVAQEGLEQIKVLRGEFGQLDDLAQRFGNFETLGNKQKLALATEGQGMLATLNACTRARKCMLVPYSRDLKQGNLVEPSTKGGCCKGQTGHHLIPQAMTKVENGDVCLNYNHDNAPVVCVEGTGRTHGTHGLIHGKLDGIVKKMVDDEKIAQNLVKAGRLSPDRKTMNLEQAINVAAQSHTAAFPFSGCSTKCIETQLKAYYGNICPNGRFATVKSGGQQHTSIGGKRSNIP